MNVMPLAKVAEFLLIASLVVGTEWGRASIVLALKSIIKALKTRRVVFPISKFVVGIWILVVGTFCALFWQEPEFARLFALLIELAGVTYLAREVYLAQESERYQRKIAKVRQYLALESLTDNNEYIREYYKLSSWTAKEAEDDISKNEREEILSLRVQKLKALARSRVEEEGPISDLVESSRRTNLKFGIVLLTLGLVGHGLNELFLHESPEIARLRNVVMETQARINELSSTTRDEQTQVSRQIGHLEQDSSSQAGKIDAIIRGNKRSRIVRPRSPQ
jgi:hypothetical protein